MGFELDAELAHELRELTGLEPYSLYSVKIWVRTVKHKKGQTVTVNATTSAAGKIDVTDALFA